MTDLSNFDAFEAHFINDLREGMQNLAELGETYIKGKRSPMGLEFGGRHTGWDDDTASLIGSITGYEAKIGDARANYNSDPNWEQARMFGSEQYPYNKPEHYEWHSESRDFGEAQNPTLILTYFTKYPDPARKEDAALEEGMREALSDSFEFMKTKLAARIKSHLRSGKSGVKVRGAI